MTAGVSLRLPTVETVLDVQPVIRSGAIHDRGDELGWREVGVSCHIVADEGWGRIHDAVAEHAYLAIAERALEPPEEVRIGKPQSWWPHRRFTSLSLTQNAARRSGNPAGASPVGIGWGGSIQPMLTSGKRLNRRSVSENVYWYSVRSEW